MATPREKSLEPYQHELNPGEEEEALSFLEDENAVKQALMLSADSTGDIDPEATSFRQQLRALPTYSRKTGRRILPQDKDWE